MERSVKINTYRDLEVWKEARKLVSSVYKITKPLPDTEIYGLTNQIRRSAISVPSNIAEGCGRNKGKDSIRFFYMARGSLYELETQLILASDQVFITENVLKGIINDITICKKLLNGFINYYKSFI